MAAVDAEVEGVNANEISVAPVLRRSVGSLGDDVIVGSSTASGAIQAYLHGPRCHD